MTLKYDDTIEENILSYLQGWVIIKPQIEEDEENTVEPIGEYGGLREKALDLVEEQSVKEIESKEVESFYDKTVLLAESYLQRRITHADLEVDTLAVRNALEMWAAGLLWKKYNLRVVDQEEDTNPTGYGDQLIVNAKSALKPYQYFYMTAF